MFVNIFIHVAKVSVSDCVDGRADLGEAGCVSPRRFSEASKEEGDPGCLSEPGCVATLILLFDGAAQGTTVLQIITK